MVLWRAQLRRQVKRSVFVSGAGSQAFHEENVTGYLELALETLDGGARMDSDEFGQLFRLCGNRSAISEGRRIHQHMMRAGYSGERFLENLLMEMYGKCGCLDDVWECFGRIGCPNEYSWTILITAYAQNGHVSQALQFFRIMALTGTKANVFTFLAAINACVKNGDVSTGKKLHELLVSSGILHSSILLGNSLIHMYGKCRKLDGARHIFEEMTKKDVVSWNSIISAYAQNGQGKEALQLYKIMDSQPDKVTYLGAMEACASTQDLEQGRLIHAQIDAGGVETDSVLGNTILHMYGKCKSLEEAKAVFDRMASLSFISWNIMILAYAQNGYVKEALNMFQRMDLEGVAADTISFTVALDACAQAKALSLGKAIHDSISYCSDNTWRSVGLDNALTNFYGRCGCPDEAKNIFDHMPMRDVVSWTAMISVYVETGFPREALGLYRKMCLEGGKPNDVTVKTALDACGDLRSLKDGKMIHSCITWEEEMGPNVGNTLMNMYTKCGEVHLTRAVFDNLCRRDLFSWTTMMRAYSLSGLDRLAVDLFHSMVAENMQPDTVAFSIALHSCTSLGSLADGKKIHQILLGCSDQVRVDVVVCNTLMNMYSRCGSLVDARDVFENMVSRNTITWNCMIKSHAQHGEFDEALALFKRLEQEKHVKPDRVTFLVAIDCCACKPCLEEGKRLHDSAASFGFELELNVGNTLVNMYGKCGQVQTARDVFERMPLRDVITWTSLVASYASNGHGLEGLELFRLMQQDYTEPNKVTFLGVLFACSHIGLLKESKDHLASMQRDYGLKPSQDHFSCLIDLLARSGKLDEAEEMVDGLSFQPDSVTLTCLLGACITQGDLKRGIRAAEYVFQLDTRDETPFVLLWNIYAAAENWDGVERVQKALGLVPT